MIFPRYCFPRKVGRHPGVHLRVGGDIPPGEGGQRQFHMVRGAGLIPGKVPGGLFQGFPQFGEDSPSPPGGWPAPGGRIRPPGARSRSGPGTRGSPGGTW